jgi:hypothetical protein
MSTTQKNRRNATRRPAKGKIKIVCYKGTLDLGENIAVKLLDVSETGIRLLVKIGLDDAQELLILLEGQHHMRPVRSFGNVIWCVPSDGGNSVVGVRFTKYLSYKDFTYLTLPS